MVRYVCIEEKKLTIVREYGRVVRIEIQLIRVVILETNESIVKLREEILAVTRFE